MHVGVRVWNRKARLEKRPAACKCGRKLEYWLVKGEPCRVRCECGTVWQQESDGKWVRKK